jgi:hypothetical protein
MLWQTRRRALSSAETKISQDATARQPSSDFTSRKLTWLDCIAADRRIPPLAFKIAYVIAQHVNRRKGEAWPSDQTIAEKVGVDTSNVYRARVLLRAAKWLSWRRTGASNRYSLDFRNVSAFLDMITTANDIRRERSRDQAPVHERIMRPCMTNTLEEHSEKKEHVEEVREVRLAQSRGFTVGRAATAPLRRVVPS